MNVRSLNKNWNAFITSKVIKADIICLQETWKIHNVDNIRLEGFNRLLYKERRAGRGGGVGMYIKEGVIYEEVDTFYKHGHIESIGIKTVINDKQVIIISIYHIPKNNIEELKNFFNSLSRNTNYIILGDVNINTLRNTTNSRTYKALCNRNGLKSTVKGVTNYKKNLH